jgi:hypothetical protein
VAFLGDELADYTGKGVFFTLYGVGVAKTIGLFLFLRPLILE